MGGCRVSRHLAAMVITLLWAAVTAACGAEVRSTGPCSEECPLVSATLNVHFDPGHVGSQRKYEVLRGDDSAVVRLTTWSPRIDRSRPEDLVPPEEWVPETEEPARSAEEAGRFLEKLAARDVCELEEPEGHIGLHPTFVDLSVRDACENDRTVEWVCEEPGRCPGDPYEGIHEDFVSFFEDR